MSLCSTCSPWPVGDNGSVSWALCAWLVSLTFSDHSDQWLSDICLLLLRCSVSLFHIVPPPPPISLGGCSDGCAKGTRPPCQTTRKCMHGHTHTHTCALKPVQGIQIFSKTVYVILQLLNFTVFQGNTSFSRAQPVNKIDRTHTHTHSSSTQLQPLNTVMMCIQKKHVDKYTQVMNMVNYAAS